MIRRPLLAAPLAAALLASALGCGKQTMVAGLMLGMPAIPDPTDSTGTRMFGPYTLLTGAVATIDTSDPTKIQDAKITGVDGVQATLIYRSCAKLTDAAQITACKADGSNGDDRVFDAKETTAGLYTLFSGDTGNSALSFEPGVRYTFVMEVPPDGSTLDASGKAVDASGKPVDTEAYGAGFKPGPPAHMVEFANKALVKQLSKGQSLTVTRDDAVGTDGQLLPAFVLVGQVDPSNLTAQPKITWTSLSGTTWPPDPKTLLLLALSDQPYRKASFVIDGSAFNTQAYFVVVMLSLAEGKASANAFIGSTALSGSGDIGLVQVQ